MAKPKTKEERRTVVQVRLVEPTFRALVDKANHERRSLAAQLELIVEEYFGLRTAEK